MIGRIPTAQLRPDGTQASSTYEALCLERFASSLYVDAYNDAVDLCGLLLAAEEIDRKRDEFHKRAKPACWRLPSLGLE